MIDDCVELLVMQNETGCGYYWRLFEQLSSAAGRCIEGPVRVRDCSASLDFVCLMRFAHTVYTDTRPP